MLQLFLYSIFVAAKIYRRKPGVAKSDFSLKNLIYKKRFANSTSAVDRNQLSLSALIQSIQLCNFSCSSSYLPHSPFYFSTNV